MKHVGNWKFERSSGYAGWRCNTCLVWVYQGNSKTCDCLQNISGKVKVTFVPGKERIRYLIHSDVYDVSNIKNIRRISNTESLVIEDTRFDAIFGQNSAEILARFGWTVTKSIDLKLLGYKGYHKAIEHNQWQDWVNNHE